MTIGEISKLYFEGGLSCREIGIKLNKSIWQVYRLMKKHNLKIRSAASTQKIQFLKKPLSFKLKSNLNTQERKLLLSGLMLYWAEGSKFANGTVDFANCDIRMLKIYILMLRRVFQVDEKRIRLLIYCYANQNYRKLQTFWARELRVPKCQFIKPFIRLDYNKNKINKMPYGLVHIRYNDKRLFMKIFEEIDIMSKRLLNC